MAKTTTEQRIFRGDHESQFAIFPNSMWEDQKISIEAKGLLGYVGSRPPRWNIRLSHLAKTLAIGRDKLRRLVRELIAAGYVKRSQSRNGNVFGRMDYWVYTQPTVASLSQTAFQSTDLPSTDLPSTEKPSAIVSKRFSKKDSDQATASAKSGGAAETRSTEQVAQPKGLSNEGSEHSERPEVTKARLAKRLGAGDVAQGWLLIGMMGTSYVDQLTARERDGDLSAREVNQIRRLMRRAQDDLLSRAAS